MTRKQPVTVEASDEECEETRWPKRGPLHAEPRNGEQDREGVLEVTRQVAVTALTDVELTGTSIGASHLQVYRVQ